MKIPIYRIDTFTGELFKGNPAAVCSLEEWPKDDLMQDIFCKKGDEYELRWFTPKGEVDLCGHAALSSAFVIFNYLDGKIDRVLFQTKNGILEVAREGKTNDTSEILVKGLRKRPQEVHLSRDYMAVFESEEKIRNLKLDMEVLKQLEGLGGYRYSQGRYGRFCFQVFCFQGWSRLRPGNRFKPLHLSTLLEEDPGQK